jgi:hypothetical protein
VFALRSVLGFGGGHNRGAGDQHPHKLELVRTCNQSGEREQSVPHNPFIEMTTITLQKRTGLSNPSIDPFDPVGYPAVQAGRLMRGSRVPYKEPNFGVPTEVAGPHRTQSFRLGGTADEVPKRKMESFNAAPAPGG